MRDIIFCHIPWGSGMITAAYLRPERGAHGTVPSRVAFAYCSPDDHWDRKRGNRIARGRLDAGKDMPISINLGAPIREQFEDFLVDNHLLPRWAQ